MRSRRGRCRFESDFGPRSCRCVLCPNVDCLVLSCRCEVCTPDSYTWCPGDITNPIRMAFQHRLHRIRRPGFCVLPEMSKAHFVSCLGRPRYRSAFHSLPAPHAHIAITTTRRESLDLSQALTAFLLSFHICERSNADGWCPGDGGHTKRVSGEQ